MTRAHKAGVESFWYKDAGKEELSGGYGSYDEGRECVSRRSTGCDDRNGEKL